MTDPDQEYAHEWIRATAARQRIYLGRHMRADDLADPTRWSSLLTRIEEARCDYKTPLQMSRLDRIRHHSERIRQGKGGEEDWSVILETVAGLVGDGMPPSNRELRELLISIIDDVPDMEEPPRGFRLVLREIDRYLANRLPPVETSLHHEQSAAVKEVARLLSGRSIVLIGGIRRREAQHTLKKLFGLDSLLWIETKEHQSVESFETHDRASRCGFGSSCHSLVEPRFWRSSSSLRAASQAVRSAASRLQPKPGCRPDPCAGQRAASRGDEVMRE